MDENMGYFYYDQFLTYVMRIAQHPTHPSTLMVAAYPGLWFSEDFGITWDLKLDRLYAYNQNQFLGWHPMQDNVLFYASENYFVLPKYFAARIMVKIGIYSTLMIPGIIHAIILLLILKTPTTYYIRAKDVSLNQMTVGKHGIVFSDKSIMEKALLFDPCLMRRSLWRLRIGLLQYCWS